MRLSSSSKFGLVDCVSFTQGEICAMFSFISLFFFSRARLTVHDQVFIFVLFVVYMKQSAQSVTGGSSWVCWVLYSSGIVYVSSLSI